MNLIPWRRRDALMPFSTDIEDLFSRFLENGDKEIASHLPEVFRGRPFPAVNVAEAEDGYTVTMDCPGLEEKDIEVEAMGNTLQISGERRWEEQKKGKEFRRVESQYGRFERSVRLPDNVRLDPKEIDATYKKGVLTINVPKIEKTPASRIKVSAS